MTIEILHRYNNDAMHTVESDTLIRADLSGVNLIGADLSGVNLIGANLSGANLIGADLSGANLSGANLIGANLIGAGLLRANLSGANLIGADLSGADLSRAALTGITLSDDLWDSIPTISNIHQAVYEAASAEGTFNMNYWHSECGTTHCRAGHVIILTGPTALEADLGTNAAAALIYLKSDPTLLRTPDWFATTEDALSDMKRLAEDDAR